MADILLGVDIRITPCTLKEVRAGEILIKNIDRAILNTKQLNSLKGAGK